MKKRTTILTTLTLTGLLLAGCAASSTQVSRNDLEAAKAVPAVSEKASEVPVEERTLKLEETVPASDTTSAKPDNTTQISEAEAKKIALAQVPGAKESDIREFEIDYDDGRLEYEGSIYYNEMEYEFEIDGYSGAIRSWEVESIYD